MKFWTTLFCTVIALQSMVVRGETWSCSYIFRDEQSVFVLVRVDGGFKNPTYDDSSVRKVLTETDRVIHLYNTVGYSGDYSALLLNKKAKTFSTVLLKPNGIHSDIVEGPCEVY